jgi:hypothetical protein
VFNSDEDPAFELDTASVESRDDMVLETGVIPVELIKDEVESASELEGDEDSALKLEEIPAEPKEEACDVLANCDLDNTGEE